MKKPRTFIRLLIAILIATLVLVLFLLVIGNRIYDRYIEVSGAEYFLQNDYVEYQGGEKAKLFFDRYTDSFDYINIAFEHHAGGVVGNYAATYILDLQYIPEQYENTKNNILVHFALESDLETFPYGGFIVNLITINEEIYNNNFCLICFDDDYNIVRYIFIYDISPKEYNVYSPIGDNTIDLNWNEDENDLVFAK